jgi:hypothetical protein
MNFFKKAETKKSENALRNLSQDELVLISGGGGDGQMPGGPIRRDPPPIIRPK